MNGRGYSGKVTLRSPSGESVTITVPGRSRHRKIDNAARRRRSSRARFGPAPEPTEPQKGVYITPRGYGHAFSQEEAVRQDKKFRRLLSAGWKVVACDGKPVGSEEQEEDVGEEKKKNTSVVVGTTKSGDASHGGKHASAEVEDSPNAARSGKKTRKCRGGQKHRSKRCRQKRSQERGGLRPQGGNGVYALTPLQVTPAILKSAEKSAELLAELVGRSHLKVRRSVTVNAEALLVALETGDNPLPPLENPDERPKLKILVTPDCSGSTQDWSGLGQAWALHLSKLPDVDVVYCVNSNGEFWEVDDAGSRKLIESVDVVLYLGDGDGHELCQRYASYGATVVALDSYCANYANPRRKSENRGQGVLHWVDRVHASEPDTWTRSIELCLKH